MTAAGCRACPRSGSRGPTEMDFAHPVPGNTRNPWVTGRNCNKRLRAYRVTLSPPRPAGLRLRRSALLALVCAVVGCRSEPAQKTAPTAPEERLSFRGAKGGDEREVAGVKLCWCPPGKFTMGSPAYELAHRPDENQVEVTLSKGFW